MGIPCSHTIRDLIGLNLRASAAHFDAYWLYNRQAPAPPVSAPDPLRDVPARLGMIDLTSIHCFPVQPISLRRRPQYYHLLKYAQRVAHANMTRLQGPVPSAWERNGGPRSSRVSCNSMFNMY
jgi:hypothetical protein